MDTESWASILLGGVTLLGSYVCRKILNSYLYQVPQFRDFKSLTDYLKSSPGREADVLVEGRIGKRAYNSDPGSPLISAVTQLEGLVKLVTITTYGVEGGETTKLEESVYESDDFGLWDSCGGFIHVNSVKNVRGLKQLLQMVSETRSARGVLTREYMLLCGTPLAGYGRAVFHKRTVTRVQVLFTPTEVGSGVQDLHYPNRMKASALKFISLTLLVVGGTILILSVAPPLVRFYQQWRMPTQRPIPQLQPDQRDDIY